MTRVRIALPVLLLSMALAQNVDARSKWWLDGRAQRHMRLTASQVRAIDNIFERTREERRALRAEMERFEAELKQALRDGDERRASTLA